MRIDLKEYRFSYGKLYVTLARSGFHKNQYSIILITLENITNNNNINSKVPKIIYK